MKGSRVMESQRRCTIKLLRQGSSFSLLILNVTGVNVSMNKCVGLAVHILGGRLWMLQMIPLFFLGGGGVGQGRSVFVLQGIRSCSLLLF